MAFRRTTIRMCMAAQNLGEDYAQTMLKSTSNMDLMRELLHRRVHMGHRVHMAHKSMYPYLLGHRNGMHVINLEKTVIMLRRAMAVLREMTAHGCSVMWVVPNDAELHAMVAPLAQKAGAYLLRGRWVPGTLSDPIETKQAIRYNYKMPGCLFIFNVKHSWKPLKEAVSLSIPVVAIADTDCNADWITYPIPGNDESPHSLQLYATLAMHSMVEGSKIHKKKQETGR